MNSEIVQIQFRRDTTTNWESSNPVLALGEPAIEICTDNTLKVKLGDGITAWNSLAYQSGDYNALLSAVATNSLEISLIKKISNHKISITDDNCFIYFNYISKSDQVITDIKSILEENEAYPVSGVLIRNGSQEDVLYIIKESDILKYAVINNSIITEVAFTGNMDFTDSVKKIF